MKPSISVIITCFNLERYIGEAINSVLAQDIRQSVEIIVVDDCSSDRSREIIHGYSGVRCLRTEWNSGVLLATLKGVEAACGELIFFLDGDDLWEPDKLARAAACFEEDQSVALVTHDLTYADAAGAPIRRDTRPRQELSAIPAEARGEKIRQGILTMGDFVWLGSALAIRRTAVRLEEFIAWARALPEPENTYQDWPLAYWVASLPVALGYVPAKLFRYRLHRANYSGDARTAARAVRNFSRTRNTLRAMCEIASARLLPKVIGDALTRRMRAYDYLIDLHEGRRGRALRGFLRAMPDFAHRGLLLKELARFAGIQILGPDRFANLAARRSIFRDTPVS